jgi:hypothetical protein
MPRYVVERTFPEGLNVPAGDDGADMCMTLVERNADAGVTWVHSYVSADKAKTFCVYDAPTPEAVTRAGPVLLQVEVTGSGKKENQNQGKSWCSFSGLNRTPLPPQPNRKK